MFPTGSPFSEEGQTDFSSNTESFMVDIFTPNLECGVHFPGYLDEGKRLSRSFL